MPLPPHRRLIANLEAAQASLDEAVEADDRLGVLPHWARGQLREMAGELEELLERIARDAPTVLGPLSEEEWDKSENC